MNARSNFIRSITVTLHADRLYDIVRRVVRVDDVMRCGSCGDLGSVGEDARAVLADIERWVDNADPHQG